MAWHWKPAIDPPGVVHLSWPESPSTIIYIYIYMCVCVCVCVWKNQRGRIDSLLLWVSRLSARQTELYSMKNIPPYMQIR